MSLKSFRFLLVTFIALTQFAIGQSFEQSLRAAYEEKIVLIRGFYQDIVLRYDSSGEVRSAVQPGSWTTSYLKIRSIEIKPGRLEILADRVLRIYDKKRHEMKYGETKTTTNITLDVNHSSNNEESIRKALARVFIADNENLLPLVTDSWKPFLTNHIVEVDKCLGVDYLLYRTADQQVKGPCREEVVAAPPDSARIAELPYKIGGPIKVPRAISTPDPSYTTYGREYHLSGTNIFQVKVKDDGTVGDIVILRPMGAGFDEVAMQSIRTWRFEPATLEGKRVPVVIRVEVNFGIR